MKKLFTLLIVLLALNASAVSQLTNWVQLWNFNGGSLSNLNASFLTGSIPSTASVPYSSLSTNGSAGAASGNVLFILPSGATGSTNNVALLSAANVFTAATNTFGGKINGATNFLGLGFTFGFDSADFGIQLLKIGASQWVITRGSGASRADMITLFNNTGNVSFGGTIAVPGTGTFAGGILTNSAVYSTPSTIIIPGTKWTNTFNARASLELVTVSTDAVGGVCQVNFQRGLTSNTTNDNFNVNYFVGLTAGAFVMTNQPWVIPDIGTNEWFLFSDTSAGGATFTIATNRMHLK